MTGLGAVNDLLTLTAQLRRPAADEVSHTRATWPTSHFLRREAAFRPCDAEPGHQGSDKTHR